MSFHASCVGERIELTEDNTIARRTQSYNGGIVYSAEPLEVGDMFQIRLDDTEKGWAGSLKFGITTRNPEGQSVPKGILELYNRADFWVLSGEKLHHKHSERNYNGPSLESLQHGDTVGLYVSHEGDLHFVVKGNDVGVAIGGVPTDIPHYVVADIYGQAKQISIVGMFTRDVVMKDAESINEPPAGWPLFGGAAPLSLGAAVFGSAAMAAGESSEEDDDDEDDDEDDDDSEQSDYSDDEYDDDGRTG